MKNRQSSIFNRQCSALVLAGLLAGCATPRGELFPVIDPPIVWPPSPETSRVKLVGEISGSQDLKAEKSGVDVLKAAFQGPLPPIRFSGPHSVAVLASTPPPPRVVQEAGGPKSNEQVTLAVADGNAAAVHIIDFDARSHVLVSGGGGERLGTPLGVAWMGQRLFVTDAERREVIELSVDGGFRRRFGTESLKRPVGIVYVAARDRFYVVDGGAHCIVMFDPSGRAVGTLGRNGAEPGEFNYPSHLAWDGVDRLVIADTGNFRVQLMDLDGACLKVIGQKGDGAGDLSLPKGVAFDSDGHLYVVDAHFENVQIFDQAGRLLLAFGQEGKGSGEFALPAGIAIDQSNRIWVADAANRRIQVFDYLGGAG